MEIPIKPELERFIRDEVDSGHYPSPAAVIEAAVAVLRATSSVELDDETTGAINRAEDQLDRGEGVDFNEFVAAMHKRMADARSAR